MKNRMPLSFPEQEALMLFQIQQQFPTMHTRLCRRMESDKKWLANNSAQSLLGE
jgi:hypothetical protein